ncbi:MAG: hypothetical protein A2Z20_08250 [Bdellovibrionales bacterium RBG_16_40_8]|nr:MAG: hypothetical protein A2Z20_08250 [Bdellovibrionales bacterium RBG_16_40_8]
MKESITLVFKRFLFVFGFYFVLRFIFFTYNIENYRNIDNAEILSAFLLGIRFDISAIIKLNGIFFLIWLMPLRIFNYGIAAKLIRFLFYSVNILFFILNLVDSELINFTGQRLTVNFFTITKDIDNQLSQLIRYYWFIALMCLLFIFVFVKYFPVKKESYLYDTRKTGFYVYVASTLVTIFLFGLGARGGLQNKPLRPAHAFRYSHSELGNLVLNSTFTLLKMSGVGEQKKVIFIDEKEMLANLLRDRKNHFSKWSKHQNVVIFIMESFALEFISGANSENGYTPFFIN